VKWKYTEKPLTQGWWEVLENDQRLFFVYSDSCYDGSWSRFVATGPFQDSKVSLDPFSLSIPPQNPLPVFVCQEKPR